jgi:hypothetical protein
MTVPLDHGRNKIYILHIPLGPEPEISRYKTYIHTSRTSTKYLYTCSSRPKAPPATKKPSCSTRRAQFQKASSTKNAIAQDKRDTAQQSASTLHLDNKGITYQTHSSTPPSRNRSNKAVSGNGSAWEETSYIRGGTWRGVSELGGGKNWATGDGKTRYYGVVYEQPQGVGREGGESDERVVDLMAYGKASWRG